MNKIKPRLLDALKIAIIILLSFGIPLTLFGWLFIEMLDNMTLPMFYAGFILLMIGILIMHAKVQQKYLDRSKYESWLINIGAISMLIALVIAKQLIANPFFEEYLEGFTANLYGGALIITTGFLFLILRIIFFWKSIKKRDEGG